MRIKRLIACLLAAATLAGMLVFPASAAKLSAFTDITDPKVAEAAEVLRVLDVVDGTGGGAFNPGRTLTRAEFCKMVIEIMGKGPEEPAQRNRTIFLDVKSSHWARGYINLAASTTIGTAQEGQLATKLIMGAGDGNFYPERIITFGEAVTILMRVLGYGNSDVATGAHWYDGYVAIARSSGLAEGLSLGGGSTITRGQAAILFYNLLFTSPKGSSDSYLVSLGGKKEDGGILLSVDATAPDGTSGAVKTTTGVYKTDRVPLDASLEGAQGSVLLDKDGKLLAFEPDEKLTRRAVSVSGAPKATYVNISGGERLDVKPETTVYQDGEAKTYEAVWQDLKPGTPMTFCYTADGKLSYIFYRRTSSAESAMVARAVPNGTTNPFSSLVSGQTGYQIYKNGVPATVADIRQYDVATYDSAAKVLNISDLRLTGVYENVYPNTETPTKITVLGTEFNVLPEAANDLQNFKIGGQLTLLLTRDGQVAGVVSTSAARSNTVGVVKSMDGGRAVVTPLSDVLPELSGESGYSGDTAAKMVGQLVTVSSSKVGQINLSKLSGSGSTSRWDVASGKLGTAELAENVKFYERVGNGQPHEISRDQITCASVPASKILYVSKDYAGKVNILVLNDVTGDLYTYGRLTTKEEETGSFNGETIYNTVVSVETDGKTAPDGWQNKSMSVFGSVNIRQNAFGGIAPSLDTFNGSPKLAGYVELTALSGVRRSAFDLEAMTVTTTDAVFPISEHVVCYNKTTGKWFPDAETPKEALNQARAYSDNLTIYYDKAPQDGGKVRIVVVG